MALRHARRAAAGARPDGNADDRGRHRGSATIERHREVAKRRNRQAELDQTNAEIDEARETLGMAPQGDGPPQRRYHFTLADQLRELAAIRDSDPVIGFTNRVLVVCALPRRNPGSRIQFHRTAGKASLAVTSVHHGIGLPYGIYPRLIMAWITTEIIRKGSPVLTLGRSLSEFMDEVGVKSSDSGGRWGVRSRFTNQLRRLLACTIDLQWTEAGRERGSTALIVEDRDLWWDPKGPRRRRGRCNQAASVRI